MKTYPIAMTGKQESGVAPRGETAGVHPAGTTREIPPASHPGVPLRDRCFKTIDAATKHGNTIPPEAVRAAVRFIRCERIGDDLTKLAFEAAVNPDVKASERKTIRRMISAHRNGLSLSPADVVALEEGLRR